MKCNLASHQDMTLREKNEEKEEEEGEGGEE